MKYIRNDSTNPYFNLALEEYATKKLDSSDDYFILWQNDNTVVIGKNQNTIEEVNMDFIEENNIKIARRLSGGGAVYHDLGNVNFTYIVDYRGENNSMERFAKAVVKALEKLGIKAEFSGRNDILVDGKKISGNAQYITKNRMYHHGTLLFDSDLSVLSKALKVKPEKISSKGIKSVKSRVANIKDYLKGDATIEEFKELILKYIFEVEGEELKEYFLTENDLKEINRLKDEKFSTWEWVFGHSPEFNISKSHRFAGGQIEANLDVKDGIIKNIKFFGDFMSMRDIASIEESLKGEKYQKKRILQILSQFKLKEYFGSIGVEELIKIIV